MHVLPSVQTCRSFCILHAVWWMLWRCRLQGKEDVSREKTARLLSGQVSFGPFSDHGPPFCNACPTPLSCSTTEVGIEGRHKSGKPVPKSLQGIYCKCQRIPGSKHKPVRFVVESGHQEIHIGHPLIQKNCCKLFWIQLLTSEKILLPIFQAGNSHSRENQYVKFCLRFFSSLMIDVSYSCDIVQIHHDRETQKARHTNVSSVIKTFQLIIIKYFPVSREKSDTFTWALTRIKPELEPSQTYEEAVPSQIHPGLAPSTGHQFLSWLLP